MSRSGTSALTRMLVAAGFYAGRPSELMPANRFNRHGYFEYRPVVDTNEQILEELGASWFQPPSGDTAADSWEERFGEAARSALDQLLEGAAGAPVVLKDPRIGLLLDLWDPVVAGRLHPVLAIRDPFEIAESLRRRDGTPLPFGLAAWELHTKRLLTKLFGRSVTVAPYRDLGSPGRGLAIVASAAAALNAECARRVNPAAAESAFDQAARRVHRGELSYEEGLTVGQLALWRYLEALGPGQHLLLPPQPLLVEGELSRSLVDAERERVKSAQELGISAIALDRARADMNFEREVVLAQLDRHEREEERLRALVAAERERLGAEVTRLRTMVEDERARLEGEVDRLQALIRSEQSRLEGQVRELCALLERESVRDGAR